MIYALKTLGTENDNFVQPKIFDDIKKGKARFGWSYKTNSNLIDIRKKLNSNNWDYSSLTNEQAHSWSMANFLLDIQAGDYLVYINLPKYGYCTVAQAIESYSFDEGIHCDDFSSYQADENRDFRHYIPEKFINTFLRNGENVHPHLYRRLVLQGRWWRIYAIKEFNELLESFEEGKEEHKITFQHTFKLFANEIQCDFENITNKILHTFPNKSLEEFVAHIISSIPNVESFEIKKGSSDFGADVIFEYKNEIVNIIEKVAVQAKAYEGSMGYQRAIQDIERAFNTDKTFTQGLIIGTALSMTEEFEGALDKLRETSNKPIGIIIGADFSKWALKYGKEILL